MRVHRYHQCIRTIPIFQLRAEYLVTDYARYNKEHLKECVKKISKRLGGDRTREALESIDQGDFRTTAMITLQYYDKAYMFSLEKNHKKYQILASGDADPAANAKRLLRHEKKRRL